MISGVKYRSLIPAIFALALCGCENKAPAPAEDRESAASYGSKFIPSTLVGLETCPSGLNPRTVVRIRIPADFDITQPPRRVRHKSYQNPPAGEDDEGQWNGSKVNNGRTPEFGNNPFHVDIGTILPSDADPHVDISWVKVRVVLRNENFTFFKDPVGTQGRILGVAYEEGNALAKDWLCQSSTEADVIHENNNERNVLVFFVKRSGTGGEIPINFVVVPEGPWGVDTPILLDPKVRNNG